MSRVINKTNTKFYSKYLDPYLPSSLISQAGSIGIFGLTVPVVLQRSGFGVSGLCEPAVAGSLQSPDCTTCNMSGFLWVKAGGMAAGLGLQKDWGLGSEGLGLSLSLSLSPSLYVHLYLSRSIHMHPSLSLFINIYSIYIHIDIYIYIHRKLSMLFL